MIKDAPRWSSPKKKCTRPSDAKFRRSAASDGGEPRGRRPAQKVRKSPGPLRNFLGLPRRRTRTYQKARGLLRGPAAFREGPLLLISPPRSPPDPGGVPPPGEN
eukprot:5868734-Pyramimonas_sp.AAC.1